MNDAQLDEIIEEAKRHVSLHLLCCVTDGERVQNLLDAITELRARASQAKVRALRAAATALLTRASRDEEDGIVLTFSQEWDDLRAALDAAEESGR